MFVNTDYVPMPQNDLHQIDQIVAEYASDPAKGLAHGVQKDAIQNSTGARADRDEVRGYRDWKMTFELIKIQGSFALVFWDEGTTGLAGDILSAEEIQNLSVENKLTESQKLARFLTRFESGGGFGPGCFGRGKLIFQGASDKYHIMCDSFRIDDRKYIALDRKIERNVLKQTRIPWQGKDAERFVKELSGNALQPLTQPGTRITIFNLKDEVVESMKSSFDANPDDDYSAVFTKMIEETWWEIISKFSANIVIIWEGKTKKVELTEPLKSIAGSNLSQGWRTCKKTNIPIVVGSDSYRIKELKFVVAPQNLNEDLRDIWVQRKRMKIGSIAKGIHPHHQILKKLCGYVILDEGLEDMVVKSEGTTHYAFRQNGKGISQIKQVVRSVLDSFHQELGLQKTSREGQNHEDMLYAMNEINQIAKDLGLVTEFASGVTSTDVEISIQEFKLPNEDSKRIEFDQQIGPIVFGIKNNTDKLQMIEFFLTAEQKSRGLENIEESLVRKDIELHPREEKSIDTEPFELKADKFRYHEGVLIVAKVISKSSGSQMCRVSRLLWLGMEEPESTFDPFIVTAYQPLFPRSRSKRVELTESIRNIRFKLTNNTGREVRINVDLLARKMKSPSADVRNLKEIIIERDLSIKAMSDKEFNAECLEISNEVFGGVASGPANADERQCDIFFSVRAAENIAELNLVKGNRLGHKKSLIFWVGIDPPGHSIFKSVNDWFALQDGRRSRRDGGRAEGYSFLLNTAHPSYKLAEDNGIKREYIKEEMLKQAYAIAIEEGIFRGVAEDFSNSLSGDLPSQEAFLQIDHIIGKALLGV